MITIDKQYMINNDKWFEINDNGIIKQISAVMLIKAINKGLKLTVKINNDGETLENLTYIELPYIEIVEEENNIVDVYRHNIIFNDGDMMEEIEGGEYLKTYKTLNNAFNFAKKQNAIMIVEG